MSSNSCFSRSCFEFCLNFYVVCQILKSSYCWQVCPVIHVFPAAASNVDRSPSLTSPHSPLLEQFYKSFFLQITIQDCIQVNMQIYVTVSLQRRKQKTNQAFLTFLTFLTNHNSGPHSSKYVNM